MSHPLWVGMGPSVFLFLYYMWPTTFTPDGIRVANMEIQGITPARHEAQSILRSVSESSSWLLGRKPMVVGGTQVGIMVLNLFQIKDTKIDRN